MVIGGGASNNLWCHIFADITGKNIYIPKNTEASSLGAAIAAAVAIGWYQTFEDAAYAMTGIKKIIKPEKENNAIYQQLFAAYKKIYPSLRNR